MKCVYREGKEIHDYALPKNKIIAKNAIARQISYMELVNSELNSYCHSATRLRNDLLRILWLEICVVEDQGIKKGTLRV